MAKLAIGACSYFSKPIIKATLFLLDLDLILVGSNGSIISAICVSWISIVILTNLGSDLFPHWSIAIIEIFSFSGLNLLILNSPFLTRIGRPSTSINTLSDLSVIFPSIS